MKKETNNQLKNIKKVELLAPAGDMERLYTAFHFGADAVYLGGKQFGLRAFAQNFTDEEIVRATQFAHSKGKKVYVTVNIFARDRHFDQLSRYLLFLQQANVDGVIVSDIGVMQLCRRIAPRLPIHISTQAGTTNSEAISFWAQAGASRVVLARECSLDDVRSICCQQGEQKVGIEVFVHGAMCVSYSGRCLLSNYLTKRGGNLGQCAQPCRWEYTVKRAEVFEAGHIDTPIECFEDSNGTYLFNSKDLCMIGHLDSLLEAGVSSLKIEGRMKSTYYVATVVNAYRRALDALYLGKTFDQSLSDELLSASHRQYTTGFYFDNEDNLNIQTSRAVANANFCAMVLGWKDGVVTVQMRNRFRTGDQLQILSPDQSFLKSICVGEIVDQKGVVTQDAKVVQEIYSFACPYELQKYDILRQRETSLV